MVFVPLTLLYVSALLVTLWPYRVGKIFVALFLMVIIYSNITNLLQDYKRPNKFALYQKDKAVKSIVDHQRGKGDFSISYFTQYGRHYGFQYFFTLYGLEPRKEIKPPIYSIVMPWGQVAREDQSAIFGDIGVIFPEMEPEQGK